MKKYLTQYNIILFIVSLLAIHMVSFPFVVRPWLETTGPSWLGLDVSWQMTLNYAKVNNWVWGKDIIYTYGPLGFLATHIGLGVSRWTFLLFDVFMVFNFFYIYRDFIQSATDKWLALFMLIAVSLTVGTLHGSDLSWVITVFSFYWMYKLHDQIRISYFVYLCINIIICFFLKLNTGLIGTVLLTGCLLNLLIFKKIKWQYAVMVLSTLIAGIIIMGLFLNVSLPDYINGALQIIKGYNDIMHLGFRDYILMEQDVAILYYAFNVFYLIYLLIILRERQYSHLFFVGIAVLYTFLLRKQAIVRNDSYHYNEFFEYSSLVLLSGYFLKPVKEVQRLVAAIAVLLIVWSLLYKIQNGKQTIDDIAMTRFASQQDYVKNFSNYKKTAFLNNRHKRYIPERILKQIGNEPIDIFPWDSEYLIENHLNYKPRPVFQSFSSYTKYLQEVNYAYYEHHAPTYIIYDYETIDERYPFNDDILINFFICKNYTFADSFVSNGRWRTLLKRKVPVVPIKQEIPKSGEFALGQDIPVDWAMMMRMNLEFTAKGKFESAYYRTPKVQIWMQRENATWVKYKVSKEVLKAGICVDRWVNNNHDFVKYMKDRFSLDRITKVRIVANKDYYKEKIKVEYYNIK